MSKLAIFGGTPVRSELFDAYNTIGAEERKAVDDVLSTGVLSKFLGSWHADFLGGPKVNEFEKAWAAKNGSDFAVSVNSNTSGLIAALGAAGVEPGDEVIVSPYSMTASASACLIWGGIPVFADIDPLSFNISAETIAPLITTRTKAIMVVHIFGFPADMEPIAALAKKHGICLIEDCAQAPFIKYKNRSVGNWGDMGIFSLNYHKHIHTGEGGVITTNNETFAKKCQLIRNHGEAVVEGMGFTDLKNMWGFNFRLPEMEAAIGIEQIKKIDELMAARHENVRYLIDNLKHIPYLDLLDYKELAANGHYSKDCEHAYYVQPMKYFSEKNGGLHRNKYVKALSSELPSSYMREDDELIGAGYVRPLYLQPLYQKKAFNTFGNTNLRYEKGTCLTCEDMHFEKLIGTEFMRPSMSRSDLDQVIEAFIKVDSQMNELIDRQHEI